MKLGRKKVDDGVLIVLAIQARKTRIEVGYGLEGVIPDSVAARVRREAMNPFFRDGKFYEGLDAGANAFIKLIDGEALPPPSAAPDTGFHQDFGENYEILLVILFVLVIVVGGILRAIFGRFFGSTVVGGLAGGAAWLITSALGVGLFAGVAAFLFSIIFSGTSGRFGSGARGGRSGGWSSGGWSSGGSWGGSTDSWSGGGGTFGGGGSSGGWND